MKREANEQIFDARCTKVFLMDAGAQSIVFEPTVDIETTRRDDHILYLRFKALEKKHASLLGENQKLFNELAKIKIETRLGAGEVTDSRKTCSSL